MLICPILLMDKDSSNISIEDLRVNNFLMQSVFMCIRVKARKINKCRVPFLYSPENGINVMEILLHGVTMK